jgi:predicted transcriptional regulator YheO
MQSEIQNILQNAVNEGTLHNAGDRMIEAYLSYLEKTCDHPSRYGSIKDIVEELDAAGFFVLRNAVKSLSASTGVSRVTIYKYLNS